MQERILKMAWTVLFAMCYPIIMTFTLLFAGITYVFSLLSKLLHLIFSAFDKRKEDESTI